MRSKETIALLLTENAHSDKVLAGSEYFIPRSSTHCAKQMLIQPGETAPKHTQQAKPTIIISSATFWTLSHWLRIAKFLHLLQKMLPWRSAPQHLMRPTVKMTRHIFQRAQTGPASTHSRNVFNSPGRENNLGQNGTFCEQRRWVNQKHMSKPNKCNRKQVKHTNKRGQDSTWNANEPQLRAVLSRLELGSLAR